MISSSISVFLNDKFSYAASSLSLQALESYNMLEVERIKNKEHNLWEYYLKKRPLDICLTGVLLDYKS
ncbi:hypothetical protein ACFLR1_00205 [Bacteroidota bacterium]